MANWTLIFLYSITLYPLICAVHCKHLKHLGYFSIDFWLHYKAPELAPKYCNLFQEAYTNEYRTQDLERYTTVNKCIEAIMPYFADIRFEEKDEQAMRDYVDVCLKAKLNEIDGAILITFLKKFCWKFDKAAIYVNDLIDTDIDIKKIPNNYTFMINYDDYVNYLSVKKLNISLCATEFNSFNYARDIAALNVYIEMYRGMNKTDLAKCNCLEVQAIFRIFTYISLRRDNFVDDEKWEHVLRDICLTDYNKTHTWTKLQLTHMTEDKVLKSIQNTSYKAIMTFFSHAGKICESNWFRSKNVEHWTLDQLLLVLDINGESGTILDSRIDLVVAAINIPMPFITFCAFFNITDVKFLNDLKCDDGKILTTMFSREFESSITNHWSKNLKNFTDHMKQLIIIGKSSAVNRCEDFYQQITTLEAIYYSMHETWTPQTLERLLNFVIDGNENLSFACNCLQVCAEVERNIVKVDFIKEGIYGYNVDMINDRLDTFRKNLFNKRYKFCDCDPTELTSDKRLLSELFFKTNNSVVLPKPQKSSENESKRAQLKGVIKKIGDKLRI